MLTRSKARSIAQRAAAAAVARESFQVSPSATGQGTHIRWKYPNKDDLTRTYLYSESLSSLSNGSSSGGDPSPITPDSSFEVRTPTPFTPQRNHKPLTTPPRLSPRKVQRSPGITQDGVTRIVLSKESADDMMLRYVQADNQLSRIADRELEILLREREVANMCFDGAFDMDVDTVVSGSWQYQESTSTEIDMKDEAQVGEEPREEVPPMAGPSRRAKLFGPEGTELVDPVTFKPYSMESARESRVEAWRQGL
ncbi:hypothetical protein C0991_005838 [Blastosporella zonata]|nr:hypothetical protein C0991_005838 [Blastosporella zonata]